MTYTHTIIPQVIPQYIDDSLSQIEEESSMLMSLLSVKHSHVWMGWEKKDVWGWARVLAGLKNRAVDPEQGTSMG
jgi:hypothetical protein